ncbi:MAG: hypothetical protein IKD07_03605 [Clostridia bacterium]|nr:hypothetical protein [Clostridia bacterium]
MIISIEKAKSLVDLDGWDDEKIEMKLSAIEQAIRSYTNNRFHVLTVRSHCSIENGYICGLVYGFKIGDTVQISQSQYNDGLYVVESIDEANNRLSVGDLTDEPFVLATKVAYPADVVAVAVNMLEWEKKNREKVGIQSETLSRHFVTYFNMGAADQVMGYPSSLLGGLKPYRKVRF